MKTIDTGGISFIEPVPGGTDRWYYGLSCEDGDLYEAEERFSEGRPVRGNALVLLCYPEGEVFRPFEKGPGLCYESPVYDRGRIAVLCVDFPNGKIRILTFDTETKATGVLAELPLQDVKNFYNLQLHTAPLSLTRQGNEGTFELLWPEKASFPMEAHESFFLRQGEELFFSRWHEEGEGETYRYWEDTVIRDLEGKTVRVLPGDVRVMPDGEIWHLY